MTARHMSKLAVRIAPLIVVLLSVSLAPARGEDGARLPGDPRLSVTIANGAWVQAVMAACRGDASESDDLIQAYDDWWERNKAIRETVQRLESGPDTEQVAKARGIFERLKSRTEVSFFEIRENYPEEFAWECGMFAVELAEGEWDYPDESGFYAILVHGAWVQAVTVACRDDAPEISGHLIQAYDEWWERNTAIRETLQWLKSGPYTDQAIKARDIFERMHFRAEEAFFEIHETDREDYARECDVFTKELAKGEWDFLG
ncbi:hypothetical protein [Pelagibius sp.]|uniref:hypothetical protein n=1 Tax=Pelagibius sp. TaxID=1931238 RepID=UPI003BAE4383